MRAIADTSRAEMRKNAESSLATTLLSIPSPIKNDERPSRSYTPTIGATTLRGMIEDIDLILAEASFASWPPAASRPYTPRGVKKGTGSRNRVTV